MFEVGKRYKAIVTTAKLGERHGQIIKDEIYELCPPMPGQYYDNWKDKNGKMNYAWNGDMCFDPTPIDSTPAPRMVTHADIGARVVRGRDWKWDNQDHGSKGIIKRVSEDGWVRVKWDNVENEQSYRVGGYGKYDLYYADEQPVAEPESLVKAREKYQVYCEKEYAAVDYIRELEARVKELEGK